MLHALKQSIKHNGTGLRLASCSLAHSRGEKSLGGVLVTKSLLWEHDTQLEKFEINLGSSKAAAVAEFLYLPERVSHYAMLCFSPQPGVEDWVGAPEILK